MLGLRGQQNLFVESDGQWREGSYVPAYVRRYPFIFLENEARSEWTLCVDEAAPQLVEGRENPLFDDDGKPTALTRSALEFCRDYQAQHVAAGDFTGAAVTPDAASGGFTVTLRVADLSAAALAASASQGGGSSLVWIWRFTNGWQDAAAVARWSLADGW